MSIKLEKISFVLTEGIYCEVQTEVILKNGVKRPEYKDRFFLVFHGYLMELLEKDYLGFCKDARRQKYLKEEAELHGEFSYNEYDTDNYSGEELIVDILTDVEAEVIRQDLVEQVKIAVDSLLPDEHNLIYALYYRNKTQQEYAMETGLSQQVVSYKNKAVLLKIKKLLRL